MPNLCRQCPIGKYKPELGDYNCSVCPDTFTTERTGKSQFSDCVCKPGYVLSADQVCVICPENTHKAGFNIYTTCNACTANSFGAAGGPGPSECSCLQGFDNNADVCNQCAAGKFKNTTISISKAMSWSATSASNINMALGQPTSVSSCWTHDYCSWRVVDGNRGSPLQTNDELNPWVRIDLQIPRLIGSVFLMNRMHANQQNIDGYEIRIGNSLVIEENDVCVTNQPYFFSESGAGRWHTCVFTGRYLTLQVPRFLKGGLNLGEIEIYSSVTSADKVAKNGLYVCDPCPQNTFTNNTGVLACEACAAGKTTDKRTGQVECVCDVGTFLGANGTCQTCPESSFKATTTDKYANRGCVTCSSCAANQQVNTQCNNTHDVACRACQANSWSSAGRKLLDPCFCNAGYELQGEICVACPVGKARQVNNDNSIVCETCGPDSFTSTTTTVSCSRCTMLCQAQPFLRPTIVSTGQVLSENIQSFLGVYHLSIASPAAFNGNTGGSPPTYFAQGGYFDKPFLRFSKTTATGGHNFLGPTGGGVNFGNGLTIVFVFRLQSELTNTGGDRWQSFASFLSMQRDDEHSALNVNVCKIGNIVHMCFSTYSGATCARADAPLGTWMQFTYTYHPNVSPRGTVRVEYTSSSGEVIVWTATNNKVESNFGTRKIAFGSAITASCASYFSNAGPNNNPDCDRPNFDTAGFYFIPTLASSTDISVLLQAVADGLQLHPRVLKYDNFDFYVRHECNASRDVICERCQTCGPGFYANNTCGVNYSNDRLDTQCVSCPENAFCPGTNTFQQFLLCSEQRCGANQQVATLCNATHTVTCKACQANSWSYAGRTELGPCLCNTGYELQGELCVACPVGKARQVNNDNSIVCETCADGTFTSVSATVTCGACSPICQNLACEQVLYDFTPYTTETSWKNYANSIGAQFYYQEFWAGANGAFFSLSGSIGWIQLTLPSKYDYLTVNYRKACCSDPITLYINGVAKHSTTGSSQYSQQITPGSVLRIEETNSAIGTDLKIQLQRFCDTYVRHECNASRDVICQECQTCGPGFYANNTCGTNYSNDRLDTQCVSCPENAFCPGTSTFQQPLLCSEQRCVANQQVATLCNTTHNITCKACQPNSWSYAGRTLLDPCFCNAGYELQGELCVACPVGKARQANANNSIRCEVCAAGTFTSVSASITCGACSPICDKCVQQTVYDFSPYNDGTSWNNYAKSIGATTRLPDFSPSLNGIYVNGGGTDHIGYIELTLPVQYNYVTVNYNNPFFQDQVRLLINGVVVQTATAHQSREYSQTYLSLTVLRIDEQACVIGKNLKITLRGSYNCYVLAECNASRDVICQECQTCGPGFYANNTCGTNYSNDRLDTQCVPCPAGSYCPTGTGPPILCPDNGKSPAGSDDLKDCDCDPGYFRDLDGCSLCHFDYYCLGKQIQYAIACPPDSRTARRGSTSRLDCHCHTGYFRDPPESLNSFNCSLCLPGDFCFNNSAYNCSDALMVSAPGSGFFDNCTCVSGYYNNGTVCEDCKTNYYCEGGKLLSCPANEWTAYEGRSYECVCMPGFYRDQTVCVPCTDNYYCDGLDDSRQACPSNSVSNSAVGIENCLCNVSYGAIFSGNVSEPHSCHQCTHAETYKGSVGNSVCLQCTECLPQQHSSWTQIQCTPRANSLCDTCSVCYNASEGGPRSQYTTQACQQFFDTECGNCSVCEWEREWELSPCSETEDATCSPITFERACPVGFYAGGHTYTTDSQCLPCAVRNTQYEGQWLHKFISAGREYNNRFSCDTTCLPFSRLVNNSDASLGCTTCETGNVLFKLFTQDISACQFVCLEGYMRIGGDCVLGAAEGDELTFWNHSLNVTHVRREGQNNNSGSGAFRVTVSHTWHGHFAVVVGASEPTCAGRSPNTLRQTAPACCFSGLWRVSTMNQLGMASAASERCSRQDALWSARLSDSQLEFEIADSRIEDIGLCEAHLGGLSCVVQVSIVDTVLLQHFSVALRLEVHRGAALAITTTETYVPLASFRVETQLAYFDTDSSPVFVVVSDMAPLQAAGITDVLLFGSGLVPVQPPADMNCARYAVGSAGNVSSDAWTLQTEAVRVTTFLRAPHGTVFIKLFYTLRLRERETTAVKNTMHIAVWRNLSTAHSVCEASAPVQTVRLGEVLSCGGLGDFAVAAATALWQPTETVRGEVGGLTSFVARALHAHVRSVNAVSMLLAFTLPPAVPHARATHMRMGVLDFTDDFRAACNATLLCHFQYAHNGRGMHFMTSCDTAAQEGARKWLRLALGVVHDAGHIMALCRQAQAQGGQQYAFLITLVNTRAYLPHTAQWHDLQNHTAPISTSNVFAVFDFV